LQAEYLKIKIKKSFIWLKVCLPLIMFIKYYYYTKIVLHSTTIYIKLNYFIINSVVKNWHAKSTWQVAQLELGNIPMSMDIAATQVRLQGW
jgi:hypothetical protein